MPQKKKVVKKDIKKVVKNVVKNTKQQPILKNSINIKIDLDDDEKKKKPRRKKRQPKQTKETANNDGVSYVDELGRPISNEIINNRSFNRSYMPQPFTRNSSVIGTTFNESTIMDKVIEKMSKLNNSNQSMNNTVLNQSTTAPARPAPARTNPAPSTIAPASPSIGPQSLNFDLASPVRPLIPMSASSMALNRVQQYNLSSMREALNSQEALRLLFKGIPGNVEAEIKKVAQIAKESYSEKINVGTHGGAQFQIFRPFFESVYEQPDGGMTAKEVVSVAWQYYTKHLPK